MKIKYYYDLLSQPSRALYIWLKLVEIPHTDVPVDLRSGEHFTEQYKDINRFQKVPCIVDDDDNFKLSESVAIFRYLIEKYPKISEDWYPKDIRKRALIDEYLEWQHNNVRLFGSMYFRSKYLEPKMFGRKPNERRIQSYYKELQKTLDILENIWLKSDDKQFLVSDKITFADLLCAAELEQTRIAGLDPFENRPKLTTWWNRVKQETNPYYDEAHQIAYKLMSNKSKL